MKKTHCNIYTRSLSIWHFILTINQYVYNKSCYNVFKKQIAIKVCFISILCNISAFAQTVWPLQLQKKISGNFTQVYADNLLNIYTVNASNQIKKYNSKGDSVAVYNNLTQYGNISSVDVTNGLKVIVYCKDFGIVNILDRFLRPINTINLRQQNILQASAVILSYDGFIWVFDEVDFKIKKIDEKGKVLVETPDCRIVFPQFKAPVKIIDTDGILYLYEPSTGFLVFDYYGAFKQQLSYTNWQQVQVNNGYISGINNHKIYYQQPKLLQSMVYNLPSFIDNGMQILRINNQCIVLQSNGVYIYNISE
jgi:hypothetical protein